MEEEIMVSPTGEESEQQAQQQPRQQAEPSATVSGNSEWFAPLKPFVAGGMATVIFGVHGVTPHSLPDALPANVEPIMKYGRLDLGGHGDPNAPREHPESTGNTSTASLSAVVWGHPLEPLHARYLNSLLQPATDQSSGQTLEPRIFTLS